MANSTLSIGLALLGGLLTVLSPCILPITPIIVGRSLQSHRFGPVALVVGLVAGFATVGSLLGVTAAWFTGLTNILRAVAIALLLGLGLLTVFPSWRDRVFSTFSIQNQIKEPERIGLTGEFWLGTQLGLLWTPCAGPVLGSILVLAAAQHQVAGAFVLLVAYGFGAAVPLLAIAYGSRRISQHMTRLRPYSARLQRLGGGMIVVTAIAILLGWDVQLQLWLAPLFPALPL
jgi:cytochrome c-type biogenesis protein